MTEQNILGRSLKLYLADGSPSGIITAEMGVSSLKVVVANRTSLPRLIRRSEASRTGVYLLKGTSVEDEQTSLVYVGEGDSVKARLSAHDSDESKDFFDRVALIVSKDENLTKAHGRYLESRLIQNIKDAGQVQLSNGTSPQFEGLPEPEIADMERVLQEIKTMLPVLGFDIFKTTTVSKKVQIPKTSNESIDVAGPDERGVEESPEFIAKIKGAVAEAIEAEGNFVLLAGSFVHKTPQMSLTNTLNQRRGRLHDNGILVSSDNPDMWITTQDLNFTSPSAASAFVAGRSDNGRTTWKTKSTNQTYSDWRRMKLEK